MDFGAWDLRWQAAISTIPASPCPVSLGSQGIFSCWSLWRYKLSLSLFLSLPLCVFSRPCPTLPPLLLLGKGKEVRHGVASITSVGGPRWNLVCQAEHVHFRRGHFWHTCDGDGEWMPVLLLLLLLKVQACYLFISFIFSLLRQFGYRWKEWVFGSGACGLLGECDHFSTSYWVSVGRQGCCLMMSLICVLLLTSS